MTAKAVRHVWDPPRRDSAPSAAEVIDVSGAPTTDQKVGGSSPSGRAGQSLRSRGFVVLGPRAHGAIWVLSWSNLDTSCGTFVSGPCVVRGSALDECLDAFAKVVRRPHEAIRKTFHLHPQSQGPVVGSVEHPFGHCQSER
jgi:hypothetical protein